MFARDTHVTFYTLAKGFWHASMSLCLQLCRWHKLCFMFGRVVSIVKVLELSPHKSQHGALDQGQIWAETYFSPRRSCWPQGQTRRGFCANGWPYLFHCELVTSILWGGSTSDPSCRGAPLCFHAWPGAPRFGVVDEDTKIVSLGRKKKLRCQTLGKLGQLKEAKSDTIPSVRIFRLIIGPLVVWRRFQFNNVLYLWSYKKQDCRLLSEFEHKASRSCQSGTLSCSMW